MSLDIVDIAREIREPNGAPYLILVTNGSRLNKALYDELCAAGVDQFSISLDFPDTRHDEFRQIPQLFAHLQNVRHNPSSSLCDSIILLSSKLICILHHKLLVMSVTLRPSQ